MKMFKELSVLLLFSIIGEGVRLFFHVPVPGSIIGILLLFFAFKTRLLKPAAIEETANFLLNNLTILFVPAGVGLMQYYGSIKHIWPVLLFAVVACSLVSLIAVGKTAELVEKFGGEKQENTADFLFEEVKEVRGGVDDLSAGE